MTVNFYYNFYMMNITAINVYMTFSKFKKNKKIFFFFVTQPRKSRVQSVTVFNKSSTTPTLRAVETVRGPKRWDKPSLHVLNVDCRGHSFLPSHPVAAAVKPFLLSQITSPVTGAIRQTLFFFF